MPERDTCPVPRPQERYYFSSGDRPLDGYTIKRAIGRGGFGEVYYAVSDSGKEVALKLLTRNIDIEKRGVQQCMNLKSPHLITIYDMRDNEQGDTFVVMEYVSGPSLSQIMEEHPEGLPLIEVRMWLKGLIEGVSYLHDHGIVHRDLKPANLFLEEGVVKIGDYGLSKFIANSQDAGHSASVGTCHYMAPEISTGKYQKPIDIYAIGVILFEMITGRVPFEGETPHEVLMKHLTSRPDLSPLPEPYRDIVSRALAKDPARRPQAATDLLVPQDAPRMPDVRFIGEGKSSPTGPLPSVEPPDPLPAPEAEANHNPKTPTPSQEPAPEPENEEILRIGEEDSVFYIGPNTMPPRRPKSRGLWHPKRSDRQRRKVGSLDRSGRAQDRDSRPPSGPPPSLPRLPSARMRVAEAATSMLIAAPLCILFALPVAAMIDIQPIDEEGALLVGMVLLGVWSVLVPTKFWEGRHIDAATRRFTLGALGVAFGALMMMALDWVPSPDWSRFPGETLTSSAEVWTDWTGLPRDRVASLGLLFYFGLTFAAGPWFSMTSRARRRRFLLTPLFGLGVVSGLAALIFPVPMPWSLAVMVLVGTIVQLVSPRSEEAARYHREVRARAA